MGSPAKHCPRLRESCSPGCSGCLQVNPFRSHLGRYPREPLRKPDSSKGVGPGSALYYQDVAGLNSKPPGGDHYSAQFRYKRPLKGDVQEDQARFAAYDPYRVSPRRPSTAPPSRALGGADGSLVREIERALRSLWAKLERQTSGEPSLLQFRHGMELQHGLSLPTWALQRLLGSLGSDAGWAMCEEHHTRHGEPNPDGRSLVPILVEVTRTRTRFNAYR